MPSKCGHRKKISVRSPLQLDFLELPREIRDMIYRFCLEVGYEIIPYPTIHKSKFRGPKPLITILSLNKQVRTEARPILYSNNKWQIGRFSPYTQYIYIDDISKPPNLFKTMDSQLFKHVVVKFGWDDVPMLDVRSFA